MRKLETGKGIQPKSSRRIEAPASSKQPEKAATVTTEEQKTSASARVQSEEQKTTPSTTAKPNEEGTLEKQVVRITDPNTILQTDEGEVRYGDLKKQAEFFGGKKSNYDRDVQQVRARERELETEADRLERERQEVESYRADADDPVISTYRSIKKANPGITHEEALSRANAAITGKAVATPTKQEPDDPMPTPPKGAVPGDDDWNQYEADRAKWQVRETVRQLDTRVDAKLAPLAESDSERRARAKQTEEARGNFDHNTKLLSSIPKILLREHNIDVSKLSEEDESKVWDAIGRAAARKGIDLSTKEAQSRSLGSRRFSEDTVESIVDKAVLSGLALSDGEAEEEEPELEPAEQVSQMLRRGEPMVAKGKPSPPHQPGVVQEQRGASRAQPGRAKPGDWWRQLENGTANQ